MEDDVAREKASQCLRDIVAALTKNSNKVSVSPPTADRVLNSGNIGDLHSDTSSNNVANLMLPLVSSMSTQSFARTKLNLPQTGPSQMYSRTAQAGLAMLQNGMGSRTANSGLSSLRSLRQQQNVSQASMTGSAMSLQSIREDDGSHNVDNGMSNLNAPFGTNSAMQISSQDLLNLQQTTMNTNAAVMERLMERKRHFASASAPLLGDTSTLFSKKYRGMVSAEDEGVEFSGSNMRNATFATQPTDNILEPIPLTELQQRYQQQHGTSRRRMEPRSASMMNLGGGPKSSSMMNLGGTSSNTGGNNLLMQLQQLQQQSKGNAIWNSNGSAGNAAWGHSSSSVPPARTVFLQPTIPSTSNTSQGSIGLWGQTQSSSNANAFASIFGSAAAAPSATATNSMIQRPDKQNEQAAMSGSTSNSNMTIFGSATAAPPYSATNSMIQRPDQHQEQAAPSGSSNNMTFFTGMGSVTGEDDEAALQRWIDRMAEEELG